MLLQKAQQEMDLQNSNSYIFSKDYKRLSYYYTTIDELILLTGLKYLHNLKKFSKRFTR